MKAAVLAGAILCVASFVATATGVSQEEACKNGAGSAKSWTMLSRDSGDETKSVFIKNRQNTLIKNANQYPNKESLVKALDAVSLLGNVIYDFYRDYSPDAIKLKFVDDCVKQGWDFRALFQ